MNKVLLQNLMTALLVVCAVVVSGTVVRRALLVPDTLEDIRTLDTVEWESVISAGHRTGPTEAPVMIAVFSDLQCSACASLALRLDSVSELYPSEVVIIHKHYPLESIHPYARDGAIAAECAAAFGRFDEFVKLVYRQQDSIGVKPWNKYASDAGIDNQKAFVQCLDSARAASIVDTDIEMANRLGFSGTPTTIVNRDVYLGALSTLMLRNIIESALD